MATINTNESFDQTWAEHLEAQKKRTFTAADKLRLVFLYLKTYCFELHEIRISYVGNGDSGQVQNISYNDSENGKGMTEMLGGRHRQPIPKSILDAPVRNTWVPGKGMVSADDSLNRSPNDVIDEAAWDVAYFTHPGFEINEGGYGDVVVYMDPNKEGHVLVKLEHNDVIETSEYTETANVQ